LATGSRIVLDTANFVVLCPYASRFSFETCILPKHQSSHFENITDREINELGMVLKTVLRKMEVALDDPPYNYVIHTAPFNQPELPHYRWHIEILPRLTRVAGFEWGSGFYINAVLPEQAAARLRAAAVDGT
jgi:UDPglucose--hexose-1-phosphate uridylyltransferase